VKAFLTTIILTISIAACGKVQVPANSLVNPHIDGIIIDELGNEIVGQYVLVAIKEEFSNRTEALQLAKLIDGYVVGKIDELNVWQIEVDVDSIQQLNSLVMTLEKEPTVRYAMIDTNA
jgi:hypothetical protein